MLKIDVQTPDLSRFLSNAKIDKLLSDLAKRVRTRLIASTPVGSGSAKRSWTSPAFISIDSIFPVERRSRGISFGNIQPYSHLLERGSKKGKRPWPKARSRTLEVDAVIRSSQAPYGIFAGAEIEQVVRQALPGLMEKLLKYD